jgi:hypothetical protein
MAMEILYIAGMAAVFVLCLALLSTARRILKPSPMSSGKLALTRLESAIEPMATEMEPDHAYSPTNSRPTVFAEPVAVAETLVLSSIMASEDVLADRATMLKETTVPTLQETLSAKTVDHSEAPVRPHYLRDAQQDGSQFHAYNYMLECLLLGVSLVVLVQTQRSTARYRLFQSSNQVA